MHEDLGHVAELEDFYRYDPDRSRELLREAGLERLGFTAPVLPDDSPQWEAVQYYLRAKLSKVFAESGIGWSLFRRGRLRLFPQRIKRVREVRAIVNRANQFGEA